MLLKTCDILVTCKLCFKALLVSSNFIPEKGSFEWTVLHKERKIERKLERKKEGKK